MAKAILGEAKSIHGYRDPGEKMMEKASAILTKARKEKRHALLEPESKTICSAYGIPVTEFKLAKDETEAVRFAKQIGYPVVLKIVSLDIIHKSDVGGVIVNLKNDKEVRSAYKKIIANVKKHRSRSRIAGVLVQEMAPPGTEVIVGATKDPQFGPTLMFGLGGIFVEVLKDVTFRIAPVTKEEASEMICEVKAYPLLKGYRNAPPADVGAIAKIILNTSRLVMEHQEIKELDLNPILVYRKGAKTVDARIILE